MKRNKEIVRIEMEAHNQKSSGRDVNQIGARPLNHRFEPCEPQLEPCAICSLLSTPTTMPLPTSGQLEEAYRIPAARNMSTPQNRCHHWQTNGACRFGAKCTLASQPAEGMGEIQDGSDFISVKVSTFEIKKRAKESISTDARGLPALTLIRTARTQLLSAQEQEGQEQFALAYASYIKAATLVKLTIDSPEHVQSTKDMSTAIRMELAEFLKVCYSFAFARV
jgi:hypothetical protein